jgi:nicotinamidase/pyrazinamidase
VIGFEAHDALIVVDVQNDFADPAGGLYVQGGEEIVETCSRLVEAAQEAGAAVVYTQDWHPPVTPHFAKDGGRWPVHCVAGTWGAELHPDLVVAGAVVRKGVGGEDGYSGFSVRDPASGEEGTTELEGMLRSFGTERVVVAGLAADVCVKETALDAVRLGFTTVVVQGATRAVVADDAAEAKLYEALRGAGVLVEP